MKKYNFLAFDIGATSGRAVLGTLVGDKFEMQELHRFPNAIMELHGKYYWDIYRLYDALKRKPYDLCTPEPAPGLYRDRYLGGGFRVSGGRRHTVGATACVSRSLYGRCAGRIFPACSPVGSLPAYRYTDHEF